MYQRSMFIFCAQACKIVAVTAVAVALVGNGVARADTTKTPFMDVPKTHWAAPAVADLAKKGIVRTTDGAKFRGDEFLTRYEAAVYLDRLVHYMEGARKPLHVVMQPDNQIPAIARAPGKQALLDLVKYRYITLKSILLVAPLSAPITPAQMADETTEVVTRIDDRRNVPPAPGMYIN